MRRLLAASSLVLVLFPSPAAAWGPQGHRAIGDAAQSALSPGTKQKIAKILGQGADLQPGALADGATWPDDIRRNVGEGAEAFNKKFPKNGDWHFVNLPLGAAGYPDVATLPQDDPLRSFVSDNDVVTALNRAITVLETAGKTPGFSKEHAIRWIVHMVGDIHQPLHVTTGYYRTTPSALKNPKIITDPAKADDSGVLGDRGGNGLHWGSIKLHGVWDGCLVLVVTGKACTDTQKSAAMLAGKLVTLMKAPSAAAFKMTGDHHTWPAQWASDSLAVAVKSEAYKLTLIRGTIEETAHGSNSERYVDATIKSPTKAAYVTARVKFAREQLTKAAVRLADLLNAIKWETD